MFQEQYDKYLENKFPDMGSPTRHSHNRWAAIEANDRVEDLTDGWLSSVTHYPDSIPISGNSDLPLWSDTYWPMKYGLTSYRYGKYQAPPWKSYQEAVDSYALYRRMDLHFERATCRGGEAYRRFITLGKV